MNASPTNDPMSRSRAHYSYKIRGAASARFGLGVTLLPRELVRGVERRHLVALGERRVVEDGLQEVVETAAEAEHGLADVDQLGRPAPDRVYAEQPAILAVEEHLEEPAVVAQDLPACDLAVTCDAGLVRN